MGAPLDSGDVAGLEQTAQTAGQVLDRRELLGATAAPPQREQALRSDRNDATVVALMVATTSGRRVGALVVFLDDCQGNHYYSGIDDVAAGSAPSGLAASFPAVSQDAATARLGGSPRLAYDTDPAHPVWWDAASGRTTPAT